MPVGYRLGFNCDLRLAICDSCDVEAVRGAKSRLTIHKNHNSQIRNHKSVPLPANDQRLAAVLESSVLTRGPLPCRCLNTNNWLTKPSARSRKSTLPNSSACKSRRQNFTLIDVREPDEVAEGAIAGSKPLPRGQLEHKIDTITADKDQPIVCYCGGGGRSALAAQSLKRMGFKK